MARIIHCADLHLGAPLSALGGRAGERGCELMLAFEKICALCKDKKADFLLICGDLFDSVSVDISVLNNVREALSRLEMQVMMIPGNHDYYAPGTPLAAEMPENVHVFTDKPQTIEFTELGTAISGVGFGGSHKTASALDGLQKPDNGLINICMLHGDMCAQSEYAPVNEEELLSSGFNYIAMGHIHRATDIADIEKKHFGYCGCPEGRGFDETGECGVFCVDVTKSCVEAQFVPICCREFRVCDIDISKATCDADAASLCLDALSEKYGMDFERHYYKLCLRGALDEQVRVDPSAVTRRLSETLYYTKCVDNTMIAVDIDELGRETTLRGIFVRRAAEKLASASDDNERALINRALQLGLRAFEDDITVGEGLQ